MLARRVHDQLNQNSEHDHASYASFCEFVANPKFHLVVGQMENYYKFSVNLDPRISNYLPTFLDFGNNHNATNSCAGRHSLLLLL